MIFEIWKTSYTRDQAEHYSADNYQDVALEWARKYDRLSAVNWSRTNDRRQ